jgi:hypothetical protein
VTVFTLSYAFSLPILTALTGGIGRRNLLIVCMAGFAAANVVAASANVEGYLIPVVMRLGRGDAPGAVMWLRRDLRRLYGEHGETILQFMLRTYDHHDIEELRAAARASPASVAA